MRRRLRGLLLGISGRYLMPLLLLILVMVVSTLDYFHQLRLIGASVQQVEITRLRERLGVEQTRLDERLGNADSIALQRIVGSMGLYDGMTAAFLEDGERRVLASLSRTDIGRPLDVALKSREDGAYLRELVGQLPPDSIDVRAVQGQPLLTAVVPLAGGLRLVALVDFGHALAVRQAEVRSQVMLVSLAALFGAACLAWLLHVMWFRRALRLADSLAAMGAGNLAVRTGLSGNDELAIIGRAADGMAQQLQADRALAMRLTELVARSPLVVFEWRNEPGWPASYVSESVSQWGYAPADFLAENSHFSDWLHPDDVGQVSAEVANYLLNGPDVYRQQYRVRSASGAWVWVDDRTTLERDAQGHVVSISGILLDITAQKEAERLQAEQSQLLRMFYDLPFLGMAISSPVNKRWLQVNDRLCEMLGYSREELLGMTWTEITVPGDLARNLELFGELLAGRRTGYQMAKRFVRKDGSILQVDMDVRGDRGSDGVLKQLFTTLQDVTARHQAEAALRDSDHRLREAQRIGRMGSWLREIDSGKAYWSDEMYRIFELDPKAFVPSVDSLLKHIHPEDQPKVVQAMELAKAHGGVYEAAIRTAPGERMKYLRARGELEMEDGRPKRLVGTVIDVTDITLAERALQEKEALLAEAQSVARIGNWSIDLETRQATWSGELYRLLGYDPESVEASVENFLRAVHPDDRDRVQAFVRQAVVEQPSELQVFEHRIERADGVRELEQRLRMTVNKEGRSVRLFGTTMDVTEQRVATRAMQNFKEMLEQAEALAKLGSWASDAETQHLTVSEQLFRNVGLDPSHKVPTDEQYLGRLHPEDRAMVAEDMQRIRSGEPVGELMFRTDPAWGPMRWMRRTVRRVLREGEGRPPRYIGTLLDITDAVEAERQLKELNQELEKRVAERTEQLREANQELEAFSYTVSHDLKAPLRGIDGYSQLLVEDFAKELGPDGQNFVHRIRHGVQQMGDLIGDLLDYSRIERREMARDPVALRPLVEQIVEGYRADIDSSGAEVCCDWEPFSLELDREGIAVVLRNLIGNALKFSRERERPVIEIGSRLEAGRRILWVRDNGVGFDMKYHDRIFAIFQRLHRAEEFPGTGVGLALVTKAVQRMGGRVWAESVLGQGATFYLEFPA